MHLGSLQHVESLDDEHVGLAHHDALARDDVVGQVRVDGRGDLGVAGLDLGDESQQRPAVVRLREALALEQATRLQLGVGEEEPVGRDELDARRIGPAGEHLAQDAGGRRLADGDRAGDADDERGLGGALAEEGGRHVVQLSRRADVEVEQSRQREVDLLHLVEVDGVAEAPQAGQVVLVEVEGVVLAKARPRRPVELDVGRGQGRRDLPVRAVVLDDDRFRQVVST